MGVKNRENLPKSFNGWSLMSFPERAYNDPFCNPWFPSRIKLPIIISNQGSPQSNLRERDRASKKMKVNFICIVDRGGLRI